MTEQRSGQRPVRAWIAITLAVLSLVLIAVFGLRALREYRRLQADLGPGITDVERIRGWMTIPYIARAYDVPPDALFSALGVPAAGNERLSIRQLGTKYRRDPVEVRATIQRAILERQRPGTAPPGGNP